LDGSRYRTFETTSQATNRTSRTTRIAAGDVHTIPSAAAPVAVIQKRAEDTGPDIEKLRQTLAFLP
jgi:hypothetical protein